MRKIPLKICKNKLVQNDFIPLIFWWYIKNLENFLLKKKDLISEKVRSSIEVFFQNFFTCD